MEKLPSTSTVAPVAETPLASEVQTPPLTVLAMASRTCTLDASAPERMAAASVALVSASSGVGAEHATPPPSRRRQREVPTRGRRPATASRTAQK